MNKIHLYDKILFPVVTEKSTNLSEQNKIIFRVQKKANKKNLKKNIENFLSEILRVLKPEGIFISDINSGKLENGDFLEYETLSWDKIDDLIELIRKNNFFVFKEFKSNFPFEEGKRFYLMPQLAGK